MRARVVADFFFFFKQKTAYEWRISDWSSDVCSSDLDAKTVMLRRYPQAGDLAGDFTRAEADIEWLMAMVSSLRRIRRELGVPPSKTISLLLQDGNADDGARAERFASQLKFLNRIERIETLSGDPPPAAAGIVGELKLDRKSVV